MKIFIVSICMVILLVGCQPTPAEPLIVGKNDGIFDAAVSQEYHSLQNVNDINQDTWNISYTTNTNVPVEVNAAIVTPSLQAIPVMRTVPRSFSNQEIEQIISYIANDSTLYENVSSITTKEWIDHYIIEARRKIDELQQQYGGDSASVISSLENSILYYLSIYDATPNEQDIQLSAVDVHSIDHEADIMFDAEKDTWATIQIIDERNNSNRCSFRFYNYGFNGAYTNYQIKPELLPNLAISESGAIDKAKKFLSDIKIDYMNHACTMVGVKYENVSGIIDNTNQCYALYFTRSINSIKTPFVQFSPWKRNLSRLDSSDNFRNPWTPEYILIEVNDSGIVSFQWHNPIDIADVTCKNVKVMTLSEVQAVFLTNMEFLVANASIGEYDSRNLKVEINRIEFGYQFLPVKNAHNEFWLVPCWVFYGQDSIWKNVYNVSTGQIIINAVDGSLV
jgi:hypothetical protein